MVRRHDEDSVVKRTKETGYVAKALLVERIVVTMTTRVNSHYDY